jgi:hypothetical protein
MVAKIGYINQERKLKKKYIAFSRGFKAEIIAVVAEKLR